MKKIDIAKTMIFFERTRRQQLPKAKPPIICNSIEEWVYACIERRIRT